MDVSSYKYIHSLPLENLVERGTQHGGLAGRAHNLTENFGFEGILTVLLYIKCFKNMPYCLILRDESPATQSSPVVGNVCVKSLIQNQAFSKEWNIQVTPNFFKK